MFIIVKTLLTTNKIELIKINEFVSIVYKPENEIFVFYITFLTNFDLDVSIQLFYRAQIVALFWPQSGFVSTLVI